MSCWGGSPWQNLNHLRTGGQAKKLKHVALECVKHGVRVAIEWPTGCANWRYPKVPESLETFQLQIAQCNGCAMGQINDNGVPIKKPWTIATNDGYLCCAMSGCKCPGKAIHPNHQP
eukprot:11603420-Heterocapsa_arctica.AAC.1